MDTSVSTTQERIDMFMLEGSVGLPFPSGRQGYQYFIKALAPLKPLLKFMDFEKGNGHVCKKGDTCCPDFVPVRSPEIMNQRLMVLGIYCDPSIIGPVAGCEFGLDSLFLTRSGKIIRIHRSVNHGVEPSELMTPDKLIAYLEEYPTALLDLIGGLRDAVDRANRGLDERKKRLSDAAQTAREMAVNFNRLDPSRQ